MLTCEIEKIQITQFTRAHLSVAARDSSSIYFLEVNNVPSKSVKPCAVKKLEIFTATLPDTATFSDRIINVLTRLELLQQVQGIPLDGSSTK